MLQGTIRASLAELVGVDLRGLGLTLTAADARYRCIVPPLTLKFIPA